MSGVEAAALVLGIISSVIAIVDGAKQVYDAAGNAQGLPEAFQEVAGRLPTVENILRSAHQQIKDGTVDNEACKGMIHIVKACQSKAKRLEVIFEKVLPEEDASRMERYLKAVRTLGKENRVELLMKGMLEDVQLLADSHSMRAVTREQAEQIVQALSDVSALPPSLDDRMLQEGSYTFINQGPGPQTNYQSHGPQYINPGSGKMYNAEKMHFGGDAKMREAIFYVQNLSLHSSSLLNDSDLRAAWENGTYPLEEVERVTSDLSKIEQSCLQSLSFPELGFRQRSITRAQANTCDWLFDNDKFLAWANRDNVDDSFGLLWMKGGPGAGKSTLMNEAYLNACEWPSSMVVAGYFPSRTGNELEKSSEGLVRTILLQVLPKHRAMLADLVHIFATRNARHGTDWLWTAAELLAFMEKHLIGSGGGSAFYLFIDGLDEFPESNARMLVSYFRKLTISASAAGASVNVCLASRNYPAIAVPLCPEIKVEAENTADIAKYVQARLFEGRMVDSTIKATYAKGVIDNARGIFLWAVLVVAQVNEDLDKGRPENTMRKRLLQGLRGISGKYTQIFTDLGLEDVEEVEAVLRFWQCVIFAKRPLSLKEFQHFFAFTVDPPPRSITEWRRSEGAAVVDGNRFIKYVNTLSRGLFEVRLKMAPLRLVVGDAATRANAPPSDVQSNQDNTASATGTGANGEVGVGETSHAEQSGSEVDSIRPEVLESASTSQDTVTANITAADTTAADTTATDTATPDTHAGGSAAAAAPDATNQGVEEDDVEEIKPERRENEPQGFDWSQLLKLVDWKEGVKFHASFDLRPEVLEAGSTSIWRMFLDGPWEPVPLDPSDGGNYILVPIHDSVKEFFIDGNGFECLYGQQSGRNHAGQGHLAMARACYAYLAMTELEVVPSMVETDLKELNFPDVANYIDTAAFSFVLYSFEFFGDHARAAEDHGEEVEFLLNSPLSGTARLVGRWGALPGGPAKLDHNGIRNECSHYVTRLHFLCGEGLFRTASRMLREVTSTEAEAIDAKDVSGKTPLYYALFRARLFRPEKALAHFAVLLIGKGADPNAKTERGEPLLVMVAKQRMLECVKVLIDGGADVNLVDEWNKDPLKEVVSAGSENLEMIRYLLSKGARPMRHSSVHWLRHIWSIFGGYSGALDKAIHISSIEVIQILLAHVPPQRLTAHDTEMMFATALERGRYDCLAVLVATPIIRKATTSSIIARTRQVVESQREKVSRGEKWTPPSVLGIQIGSSVSNTFNPDDAGRLTGLLNEAAREIDRREIMDSIVFLLKIASVLTIGFAVWYGDPLAFFQFLTKIRI